MFTFLHETLYCENLAQEVDPVHAALFHATAVSHDSEFSRQAYFKNVANLAPVFMADGTLVVEKNVLDVMQAHCSVESNPIELIWYEYECPPGDMSFVDDAQPGILESSWSPDIVRSIAARYLVPQSNKYGAYRAVTAKRVKELVPMPSDLMHYRITRHDSILVTSPNKFCMSQEALQEYGLLRDNGYSMTNNVANLIASFVWEPWFELIRVGSQHVVSSDLKSL